MIAVDPFTQGNQHPRYIGPELRGPADADGFRVKVGRYGDRWYHDPLPGDHVAPACETVWPSVSTVKKASGNDWSFTALERVAKALDTEKYRNLARWPYADRYEALKAINKIGLNGAGQRGTNIHLAFDALLHGQPMPISDDMPGAEYRGAIDQFFTQYNPTLVAAEFVCINRTLNGTGYGGTADAIVALDGKQYIVDWKSRGPDSDHGAYPEEAAQASGYWGADYIIVEGRDGPERRLMPTLDGGLIVSIKPDGCRIYPVDLDKGFAHWSALHAWWVARRDEREAVGRQWPARKTVTGDTPISVPGDTDVPVESRTSNGAGASAAVSSTGATTVGTGLPITVEQLQVTTVSTTPDPARLALVGARATLATTPTQGADLAVGFDELWDQMRFEFDNLPPEARAWRAALVSEAQRCGVAFHVQVARTERAYHINRALITLATAGHCDDDIVRALLAPLVGDVALFPGVEVGHCLGSLSHVEAERFAGLVDAFVAEGAA